jgi:cytochrome oxidase Cu insertion factor (SCO1/SenC/PrrC family)
MFGFRKHKLTSREKKRVELRALQIALAILLGIFLAVGVAVWQMGKDHERLQEMRQTAAQVKPEQALLPPGGAKIGGPFTLVNQDGKTVTDRDYHGKYQLIYFGYTYCPDLCPTGLQSIAHALDQLGPAAKKVQPIFITIDPARDTPAKLKEYDASFHPAIVGLTGSPEQVAAAAKAFQVYYTKGEQVDEHDYVMDHSSLIYLMDQEGHFITTFDEEASPAVIVGALKKQWDGVSARSPSPKPH